MKITIRNLQKKVPLSPSIRATIRKAALKAFSSQKTKAQPPELTVCLVDNKRIKELNLRYLGKECPTDVLAFDLSVKPGSALADIIVSAQAAVLNSKVFKTEPLFELYLYVVHGILHLLGYDDANHKQRKVMDKKAKDILKAVMHKS